MFKWSMFDEIIGEKEVYIKENSMFCYESFFIYTFFSLIISSNIHHLNIIFHEFKVLKKVIKTETFNVDFHKKFI